MKRTVTALVLLLVSCEPGSAGSALRDLSTKIDAGALIACSRVGDFSTVARCLGAEVVTQGLRTAYDYALEKTQNAIDPERPSGAEEDLDPEQAITEMEAALEHLNREIALTNW